MQSPSLLVILALANVPILLLVLRLAFESWSDLGEALVFWLGPVWLQILDVMRGGDWNEHQWDSLKLVVLVISVVAVVFSEYSYLCAHVPGAVSWANRLLPFGSHAAPSAG